MSLPNETHPLHGNVPTRVGNTGVTVVSHESGVIWVIKPQNPVLSIGDRLPAVVYGDVEEVIVDGQPSPRNNLTYAKVDFPRREITVGSRSLDPARR